MLREKNSPKGKFLQRASYIPTNDIVSSHFTALDTISIDDIEPHCIFNNDSTFSIFLILPSRPTQSITTSAHHESTL